MTLHGYCVVVVFMMCAVSCANTVPPRTIIYAPLGAPKPPIVLVSAPEYRAEIEEGLRSKGIVLTEVLTDGTVVLQAEFGTAPVRNRCGVGRNIMFDLRNGPLLFARIKARGILAPGCKENVLDQMTEEVARLLGSDAKARAEMQK